MRQYRFIHNLTMIFAVAFMGLLPVQAQEKAPAKTTPVRMTVTLQTLGENKRMPEVKREDVIVRQGKDRLKVTDWTPARGDQAGLDLFVLIDDASDSSLGSQLEDLRAFINARPPTTSVGVGYMRNATVEITQNFTNEHSLAASALRLPLSSAGAYGSPYLSLMDLMKRWPADSNRHVVLMVTDGIDRARIGGRYRSLAFISPDVDLASSVAQRTGTIVDSIFTRGIGRSGRNFWEIINGQNSMSKLSEETGGEAFYLGTLSPVSFKPYLDDLQKMLENQYILEFQAIPGAKSGLRYVKLSTEIAGVELISAESVWVETK